MLTGNILVRWRSRFGRSRLTQTFDEVKIGEKTAIAVGVALSIGRGQNGDNVFHSCRIRRHQLMPQVSMSRSEVEQIDLGRQIASTVDESE